MMLKILYLEDSHIDARLIKHVLGAEDIEASYTLAPNRQKFEEALIDFDFDLVLADYQLLDYNALEAINELRSRMIDVPILLVSGAIDGESAVDLLKAGATDYVLKDHLARLAPAVGRALEEYDQMKQIEAHEKEIQDNHTILSQAEKLAQLGAFEWELPDNNMTWTPGLALIFEEAQIAFDPSVDNVRGRIHPDDQAFLNNKIQEFRQKEDSTPKQFSERFRLLLNGNTVKYVSSRGVVYYNSLGVPVRVVGVLQDVSQQIQAELAIQELNEELEQKVDERTMELRISERKYRLISENMTDLVSVHSAAGRIEYISNSVKDLLGYRRDELMNTDPQELVHPEDLSPIKGQVLRSIVQGNLQPTLTARIKKKDGSYLWAESHLRIIRMPDGKIHQVQASTRDISTRKKAEEQMAKTLQQERELNELRSRFVSMASHQFRTPLTIMQSNLELMDMILERPKLDPFRDKLDIIVKRLIEEVSQFNNLMDDILEMGKIDARELKPQIEPVNLHALVADLVKNEYGGSHLLNSGKFYLSGVPRLVPIDKRLISHVLVNLISNAVKYSIDCPAPEISIRYCTEHVFIDIKDYGIGIPEEDKDLLCNSWFRASNTTDIKGTGLGLAIAKEFVEAHQGELSFTSVLHQGSTFTVKLPTVIDIVPS